MLRPVIMIGCGGSGQKVVRCARDAVERQLKQAGWNAGFPRGWQFIGVDLHGSLDDPSIPFLPQSDFVNITDRFSHYQELETALQSQFGLRGQQPNLFREFIGWRPNPADVMVPLPSSAGQLRAVGRMSGVLSLRGHLHDRIRFAFESCDAGGPELLEVSRHLGVDVQAGQPVLNPIVLIVGSMAGGTGAGIMLDVADLVRAVHVNGTFPTLVALTPDVFGSVQTDGMTANSAAFMSELLNAYWDDEMPENGLIPPIVAVHTRGPHSVYVIGRRNLDGLDLFDSRNVYRAVGNSLAAMTTSIQVQQNFCQYNLVNWTNKAVSNAGGYGFDNQSHLLKGVASSFGSSTISIGRERFREYVQRLLLRSIVEQLAIGFEKLAIATLGDNELKPMSASKKISELSRRNFSEFISEIGTSFDQIREVFFSNEQLKSQLFEISSMVKSSLPATGNFRTDEWISVISSQAQACLQSTKQTKDYETHRLIEQWSSEVYQQMLLSSTDYSAKLSIPVVISMIEMMRAEVLNTASQLREQAITSHQWGVQTQAAGIGRLPGGRAKFSLAASVVQDAINEFSKAIVLERTADLQENLASTLDSLSTSVLSRIQAELQRSLTRLSAMTTPQEGAPPVLAEWPRNNGQVPLSFTPGPLEFLLEDYATWPQRAVELIHQSLERSTGLPIHPLEAARTIIINGGFVNSTNGHSVLPLIWDEDCQDVPNWSTDQSVAIRIDDSIARLSERVDAWLSRPATEVNRALTEGLASYLMPIDPITGAQVPDHVERLRSFSNQLLLALQMSRPLVEIDQKLNATVHPMPVTCSLQIGGLPFGVGHPARQMAEQIIQSYLGTSESVDWAFISGERESVQLVSFLDYPINPSVITSFTEPLAISLNRFNSELLQSSFWQWRRAQVLGKFVPLPPSLRRAAIRGLAIARALGVMSAESRHQNVIATRAGDILFPRWLLTSVDQNNLLPALLEAMVLTFADAPTKGKEAFNAYGALVEYGSGEFPYGEYQVGGLLGHFLETGEYDGVRIVDHNRADHVSGENQVLRTERVIEYLQRNIERFEQLEGSGPDLKSWRSSVGSVAPVDTLSLELLPQMRHAYEEVRNALRDGLLQVDHII